MPEVILDCSGRQGIQHEEADEAMRRSGNPCWGWLRRHTYFLRKKYRITKMHIKLKAGPSEYYRDVPIYIEYSEDGKEWHLLREVLAPTRLGEPPAEYTIDCDITACWIKFEARAPFFVDFSYAELEGEEVGTCEGAGFRWTWVVFLILLLMLGAVMMVRSRRV